MKLRSRWCGFFDEMIEHSFERLLRMMTNNLNLKIKIVSKLVSPNNLVIDKLVNRKINNKDAYHYF